MRDNYAFASLDDAKRVAHALAHWYIEGKRSCDCADELSWQREPTDHPPEIAKVQPARK